MREHTNAERQMDGLRTDKTLEGQLTGTNIGARVGVQTAEEVLSKARASEYEDTVKTADETAPAEAMSPLEQQVVAGTHSVAQARDMGSFESGALDLSKAGESGDEENLLSALEEAAKDEIFQMIPEGWDPDTRSRRPYGWLFSQFEASLAAAGHATGAEEDETHGERRRARQRAETYKAYVEANEETEDSRDFDSPYAFVPEEEQQAEEAAIDAPSEAEAHPERQNREYLRHHQQAVREEREADALPNWEDCHGGFRPRADPLSLLNADGSTTELPEVHGNAFANRRANGLRPGLPAELVPKVWQQAAELAVEWEKPMSAGTRHGNAPTVMDLAETLASRVGAALLEGGEPNVEGLAQQMRVNGWRRAKADEEGEETGPEAGVPHPAECPDPLARLSESERETLDRGIDTLLEDWDPRLSEVLGLAPDPDPEAVARKITREYLAGDYSSPNAAGMHLIDEAREKAKRTHIDGQPWYITESWYNNTVTVEGTVVQLFDNKFHHSHVQSGIIKDDQGREAKFTIHHEHLQADPEDWRHFALGTNPPSCDVVREGDHVLFESFRVREYRNKPALQSTQRNYEESNVEIVKRGNGGMVLCGESGAENDDDNVDSDEKAANPFKPASNVEQYHPHFENDIDQ